MKIQLYLILLTYFIVGGIAIYIINKNKATHIKKQSWLKFYVYFILINLLFISIIISPILFHYISIIIIILGFYEILNTTYKSKNIKVGILTFLILLCLSLTYYNFSLMPSKYLFYTLFLTTVFDSFSQLTGQLLGKKKLFKKISPNKTVAGLLGGIAFTLITSILIHNLLSINIFQSAILGLIIAGSALLGDFLASYCKRKLNIKDFSNIIPGHGGVLDRFDSLIFAGSFMFITTIIF